MFGFRFIKTQPTTYLPAFRGGKVVAENGVIFSDGIEHDFLAFDAGALATITVAERTGRLIQ